MNRCFLLVFLLILLGLSGCRDYPGTDFRVRSDSGVLPVNVRNYLHTDSVIQVNEHLYGSRLQFDSLVYLTHLLKNYDEDAALVYAREANQLALQRGWELADGISRYYVAMLKGRREVYGEGIEDAIVDARIALRVLEKKEMPVWVARTQSTIGFFHSRKRAYDSALVYLNLALATVEKGGMKDRDSLSLRGEILHGFANVFIAKDPGKVQEYYRESLLLYQLTDNQSAMSRLKLGMGILFYRQKQYEKAEPYIQQSIQYAEGVQDIKHLVEAYHGMGTLRLYQYRQTSHEPYYVGAMEYFHKSLGYQQENFYKTYNLIGNAFQSRASRTNEVAYIDSALIYYNLAMKGAKEEGVLPVMNKMAGNISKLCTYLQNTEGRDCSAILGGSTANVLQTNYEGIVGTITANLQDANKRIQDFERNEVEAAGYRQRRSQLLIAGSILVFLAFIFLLVLQNQQKKKLKARMDTLRAQVNPHFISNSLNAIESLVNQNRREEASKYLVHFSRLSRRILNGSHEANTTLAGELETLKHFLALEQLRFRDKLKYEINVDPDLRPDLLIVPALILQPYVENAIWHGIKPKSEEGLLTIDVTQMDKNLVCTVEDDGVGREKAAAMKADSVLPHKSMGTKITEERLLATGKMKGSRVDIIDLKDKAGNARGTRVVLRIPIKRKKVNAV
ncbi:histidine kinase [bacterium]|nr:histidine kinase [bacterium]